MLGGFNTEIHIAFKNIFVEPAIRQYFVWCLFVRPRSKLKFGQTKLCLDFNFIMDGHISILLGKILALMRRSIARKTTF